MFRIEKSYSEFTNLLDNLNLYYDYEDKEYAGERILYAQRNSNLTYYTIIPLLSPGDDDYSGSYSEDFDENYKSNSGEKIFRIKSWKKDSTIIGDNIIDIQLTDINEDNIDAFLYQGSLDVENSTFGDTLKFQVIDKDNILGYGENFIIREFVDLILSSNCTKFFIKPPTRDYLGTVKKIPSFLYLRCIYNSQNILTKFIVSLEYEY